jgi:hypothetical protein
LLGDGDRDGKTDLVASRGAATLYAGDGQGGFGVTGNALPASGGGLAVAADFDGDGATDLALANSDGDALGVRVLRNQGGAFVMGPVYASGYWSSLLAADLDGDGHTDLAGTAFQTGRIEWLLGAGDGSFRAGAGLTTGQDPRSLYIGDLDRDGATDLAVVEYGDHDLRTYYGDGHGGFGAPVLRALGDAPYALLVADWTGDGKLDLLVIENNAAEVLVAAGGRDYAPPTRLPGLGGVSYAPAHDWNGDGKLDLAATYHFGAQGGVQLFAGNGDGSFADPVVYASTTASLVALDAADFDGDGAIDLVGIGGALVVLLGDGRGGFEAGGEYAAGAGGTHLVVLDANADHAPDVLVGQTTLLTNRRR